MDASGALRSFNAEREAVLEDIRGEMHCRRQAYQDARGELEEAENEYRGTAAGYGRSFDRVKRSLESLKLDCLGLKRIYEQEYQELEMNKESAQRAQFLRSQLISDSEIRDIGPTLKAACVQWHPDGL